MDLQAKLEQAQRDNNIVIVRMAKEIEDIEKQIADSEVTYSIGDRFAMSSNGEENRMLVGVTKTMYMIDLDDGCIMKGPARYKNCACITQNEFKSLTGGFLYTRTNRKQCKC